jgi:hypothetical protein
MRSSTLHLFAAAVLAIPTLTLAQSANPNQNDPFYAPPQALPRIEPPAVRFYGGGGSVGVEAAGGQRVYVQEAPEAPEPQEVPEGLPHIDAQINQDQDYRVEKRVNVRPTPRKVTVYTAGGGSAGMPGAVISSVPPAMAAQLRLEPGVGVVIEQVAQGSPLEGAGIEQYDVIERVNQQPVHRPQELAQALRRGSSGSATIDIVRQARRRTLTVDTRALSKSNAFSFGGGAAGGFGPRSRALVDGNNFQFQQARGSVDPASADRDREQADRDREQADRDRAQAQRERAQADRERARAERQSATDKLKNVERDQINAIREQIKSQLDRERGELDKAREELNRATQEMNQQLSELRSKLESEVRTKVEAEIRRGEDQIKQKMQLLEDRTQELQRDDESQKK